MRSSSNNSVIIALIIAAAAGTYALLRSTTADEKKPQSVELAPAIEPTAAAQVPVATPTAPPPPANRSTPAAKPESEDDRLLRELKEAQATGDSRKYGMALKQVGDLRLKQRRPQDALPHFKDALAKLESDSSTPKSELGAVLAGYGTASARLGDFAVAEPLLRRAIEMIASGKTVNDPALAPYYRELSGVLRAQGKWTQASEMLDRAKAIQSPAAASGK